MSREKFIFDNFLMICERIKDELKISKDKELIELIETTQPTFSRRKGENNFSVEWAYLISIKTGLHITWILTGKGPRKMNEPPTKRKFEVVNDLETWLEEITEKEPYRKDWFQGEIEDKFPAFKAWKERKDGKIEGGEIAPISKVA